MKNFLAWMVYQVAPEKPSYISLRYKSEIEDKDVAAITIHSNTEREAA